MIIAGAGAIEHEELVNLSRKLFSSFPSAPPEGKIVHREQAVFTGSDIRVRDDVHDHAHIAFAFPTAGWTDPDNFPLMVIQSMLGCWDKNSSGGIHSSSSMVSEIAKGELATSV